MIIIIILEIIIILCKVYLYHTQYTLRKQTNKPISIIKFP